jgi:hypothetical protein
VNALFAAAVDVQGFFASRGWRSTVIGGLAVMRWGEPRQTRDVDLTLLTGLGGEECFIDPILAEYRSRIADGRQFALEHRVVLIETSGGGIIVRQGPSLVRGLVLDEVRPLLGLKEDEEAEARLQELFTKHAGRAGSR